MKSENSEIDKFTNRPRLLLIYDYFDPAVLAGGPIVSCMNMVNYLHNELDIYIYCSNRDLDKSELSVDTDRWVDYAGSAKVIYAKTFWSFNGYLKIIKDISPDVIYINGIYSFNAVIVPLLLAKMITRKARVVIAPRGMLQTSAINIKRFKKKIYFILFRRLLAMNKLYWHVTGDQEQSELKEFLTVNDSKNIILVGNIPTILNNKVKRKKNHATLRLLTVALISPMKNILKIIQALANMPGKIVYTIYGSIKDQAYWNECLQQIEKLPSSIEVNYAGMASHKDVSDIMLSHDIYIQPSKSENFSHSIYEALTSGMPVITSHNTPWHVQESGAGWNINSENIDELTGAISAASRLNDLEYNLMSNNARQLADDYLQNAKLREGYLQLFNV